MGTLPNTLIIGAQKAGTTSLFHYLAQHPEVSASLTKEVRFFDLNFDKGLNWYRSHFRSGEGKKAILEASPFYLYHPLAPRRARSIVPDARIVVTLRNPVSRAYSHYQHQLHMGREQLGFEGALDAEEERLGGSALRIASDAGATFNHQHFSYIGRGLYADQIRRWLDHYPEGQFLFLKAEDMFKSPQGEFSRICEFLGLAPLQIPDPEPRYQRDYEPMAPATRERLSEAFVEPNRELEQLTGINW